MTRFHALKCLLATALPLLGAAHAKAQEAAFYQRGMYGAPIRPQQGQATHYRPDMQPIPAYGQTRGAMGGGLIEALFGGARVVKGPPVQKGYGVPGQPGGVVIKAPPQAGGVVVAPPQSGAVSVAPPQVTVVEELPRMPATTLRPVPVRPPPLMVENGVHYPSHAELSAENSVGWVYPPEPLPPVRVRRQQLAAVPLVSSAIREPALARAVREDFISEPRGMDPRFLPQIVSYPSSHGAGTIVIDTGAKYLYLIEGNGQARRYGIGVGRPGFSWRGMKQITRKAEWPDWRPPSDMLRRRPDLPRFMAGGPNNPLGARALYLGSSLYRIHGSNEPHTIGQSVSSGCFRMRNEDVIDLYNRVKVGTKVVVT